jgi:hypothetical protein
LQEEGVKMEKDRIKFDYSNGREPYVDQLWINIATGKLELIRIPKRPVRNAAIVKYHKPNIKLK